MLSCECYDRLGFSGPDGGDDSTGIPSGHTPIRSALQMTEPRSLKLHPTTAFSVPTFLRFRRNGRRGVHLIEVVNEAGICFRSFYLPASIESSSRERPDADVVALIEAWLFAGLSQRHRAVP